MKTRRLGKTEAGVSEFMFGCGNVGGIMIRADPDIMKSAVEKALAAGINWFDTAGAYGGGVSETNLGRILRELGASPFVSTKLLLDGDETGDIPGQTERLLHESLQRLQRDRVDLVQLHNYIAAADGGRRLRIDNVLGRAGVLASLERLRDQGLLKWIGITALGDTGLIRQTIETGRVDTAQVYFNMINPTAAHAAPRHAAGPAKNRKIIGQDFCGVLHACQQADVGVIAIRTLAAGVLATETRHGRESVIISDNSLAEDERKAAAIYATIGDAHGTRAQTALRFALSFDAIASVDFAVADLDQFDEGIRAAEMGPLPADVLQSLDNLYDRDFSVT